jgi:hypothetical protein
MFGVCAVFDCGGEGEALVCVCVCVLAGSLVARSRLQLALVFYSFLKSLMRTGDGSIEQEQKAKTKKGIKKRGTWNIKRTRGFF